MNGIYKQSKNIIFRREEDEAILFNADTLDIVILNVTGCLVWSLCDGKICYEEIIKKICEQMDITYKKVKKDIDKFLSGLEGRNFIEKI